MKFKKYMFSLAGCLLLSISSYAYKTPESGRPAGTTASGIPVADLRTDCARSGSQIDQDINNVRARLQSGGDVWWDRDEAGYIVPKVPAGQTEVSSIFAGAVWLGGRDDGGNLKVACQTYGPGTDFWPGPLDENGEISEDDCRTWDQFFTVTGADVRQHAANFAAAQAEGVPYDPNDIPEAIKGWPALGNEFFEDIHEFRLPFDEVNGLAGFWDYGDNGVPDGRYDPELGDFPIVEIRGCVEFPVTFPDQMIFWIYNDNGNIHTETNADAIRMEVQVQAFAFESDDEINNMTFQRYKLINRAIEPINETYFAMWVDGDLGCFDDDYIGCDTSRSLAYYYNQDAVDGNNDGSCQGGVPTYGTRIPVLGVDYFRGPLDENFAEIGMSSFTYYNNNGIGGPWPQGTVDPQTAEEYYNYLSGNWRDGTPFSFGGSGYNPGSPNTVDYAFIDPPDLTGGWSMCEENSPLGDRRTIQASGPFTLLPGAKNELIVGVVWLEELNYPCPDIDNLLLVDDVAQALFNECFKITRGPSAPDMDFIELDKELVAVITNDPGNANNNNINENYRENDLRAPAEGPEYQYVFEGYQIYQLAGPTSSNLEDIDQARLIREMDVRNGVSKIFNWAPIENPLDPESAIWTPTQEADGLDEGIQHTFLITEDQFATGDRSLVNHKTYYYTAIAYGHNNWQDFSIVSGLPFGQRSPYISGDLNIRTYTPVPRPINDYNLNSFYGEGVVLERLEGKGNGGNFLELTDESFNAILEGSGGNLFYKPGQGPVKIQIINPVEVKDGNYELTFSDDTMDDEDLSPTTRWVLRNLNNNDEYFGEKPIDSTHEQIIQEIGLSITIGTPPTVGDLSSAENGALGAEVVYANEGQDAWLFGFSGDDQFVDFIDDDDPWDPTGGLSGQAMEPNFFVPFLLTQPSSTTNISPMIEDNAIFTLARTASGGLGSLNNVDIVFTKDKSKWSKCMIIETSPRTVSDPSQANWATENGANHFQLRKAPSVTKEADGDGAKVDPSGGEGFGYFPGYAIDVETGQRLNIFFGEASSYDCEALTAAGQGDFCTNFFNGVNGTGRDMMWNPTPQQQLITNLPGGNIAQGIVGGHHWVYVTKTVYDECAELAVQFESSNPITRRNGLADVTWTGAILPFRELTSYADGLIPEDVTYKLRVSKPLGVDKATEVDNQGYPKYRFKVEGKEAVALSTDEEFDEQLAGISIVPNPYYGFSSYEPTATSTVVKLTNLPNECSINIFSLEGKFIRSYNRNVGPNSDLSRGGVVAKQAGASVDWDLKNSKGIPVASGTYLVNVNAPGIGERTLKVFLVQRQFDPSGL